MLAPNGCHPGRPPLQHCSMWHALPARRPHAAASNQPRRRHTKARATTDASSSSSSSTVPYRPIEVSRALSTGRATESARPDGLFHDPFAALLAEGVAAGRHPDEAAVNVVATRYIDECLMNAIDQVNINSINQGEYRQVVLLGDGFDTRPFRLPWPQGTILFIVAPSEAHERAEALLASMDGGAPHVERGCLLRRVDLNLSAAGGAPSPPAGGSGGSDLDGFCGQATGAAEAAAAAAPAATILMSQLERAGFRQDRLSLWALQGLHGQDVSRQAVMELLADVTNCAAFHSLLVGELPLEGSQEEAENALADVGLLGATYAHESEEIGGGFGRLSEGETMAALGIGGAGNEGEGEGEGQQQRRRRRWLFAAQQMRMSLAQMGVYERHAEAAEETDEDFFGHFS